MKNQKGITLVALVVTIVVLIILAVISINVIFGERGIIAQAQKSREKQEIAEYMDKFNVAEATTGAKNEGEVTLDLFIDEVISEGIILKANIVESEDGSYYTLTSDEGYVFEAILKKENDVEITYKLKGVQNKDIKLAVAQEVASDFSKSTITIEIESEKEISSINLNNEEIEIPTKTDDKYIITKENKKNGTYTVLVKDKDGEYKMKSSFICIEQIGSDLPFEVKIP